MDINSLGYGMTDYLSSVSDSDRKLNSIKGADYSKASDEELMSACKEFEAYLVEMVMKEVTKTVDILGSGTGEDSDSGTSTMKDYVKDSLVQKMSEELAGSADLGIAQELYKSMKRNYEI